MGPLEISLINYQNSTGIIFACTKEKGLWEFKIKQIFDCLFNDLLGTVFDMFPYDFEAVPKILCP